MTLCSESVNTSHSYDSEAPCYNNNNNSWESVDEGDLGFSSSASGLSAADEVFEQGEDETQKLRLDDPLLSEYQRWKDAMEKCILALDKKQKSLSLELEKAQKAEATVERAELITSNMYLFTPGVRTATVADWNRGGAEFELTLDAAYGSASEEADALFTQARKQKRGSQIVRPLLAEIDNAKESLTEIELDFGAALISDGTVNENVLRLVQDRLLRTSQKTGFREPSHDDSSSRLTDGSAQNNARQSQPKRKPAVGTPASNLRKFTSPGGCVVVVGRNRKGNEYLTFNVARGDDIWMQ